jgi:hypothetical protein
VSIGSYDVERKEIHVAMAEIWPDITEKKDALAGEASWRDIQHERQYLERKLRQLPYP